MWDVGAKGDGVFMLDTEYNLELVDKFLVKDSSWYSDNESFVNIAHKTFAIIFGPIN